MTSVTYTEEMFTDAPIPSKAILQTGSWQTQGVRNARVETGELLLQIQLFESSKERKWTERGDFKYIYKEKSVFLKVMLPTYVTDKIEFTEHCIGRYFIKVVYG